ncbi:hypothetical protein HOY80DRAFT_367732 [Tuber brumale]|nr:hypothetical protein HOY80DRAFT_367732 [Tuber brumale]
MRCDAMDMLNFFNFFNALLGLLYRAFRVPFLSHFPFRKCFYFILTLLRGYCGIVGGACNVVGVGTCSIVQHARNGHQGVEDPLCESEPV